MTEQHSPIHSLLLRQPPLHTTKVQYKRKPYHRLRPRTLHRYEDGTLLVYNEEKNHVETVTSIGDGFGYCGKVRAKIPGGFVKFNGKEERGMFLESIGEEGVKGGRWRFVRRVGGGSGGSVWLVEDENGKKMGVKVVEKEGIVEGESLLRRVVEERRALEVVEDLGEGCVVGLEGAWQSERRLYLGMRWFGFGDLGRLVNGRALRESVVKGVVAEVVMGLEELRMLGFVHRDLKVENCLVDENGHVVIGDLGMIKMIGNGGEDGSLGRTRSFCGTRSSMAPEMIMGKNYGYSVDMWALGVMIYRLLTGRMPFGKGSYRGDHGQALSSIALFHEIKTAPVKYPNYLSEDVKSLLRGLFDRYVGDRFDLNDVKKHAWFKDIDWDKVKESARLQQPVSYTKELFGNTKPLVDEESLDCSHHGGGQLISNVTLSELGDIDEYTPRSSDKKNKKKKSSKWASGKLLFSSKISGGRKYSSGKSRGKKTDQEHIKIWGYDFRPPSNMSSISKSISFSPVSSRRESSG